MLKTFNKKLIMTSIGTIIFSYLTSCESLKEGIIINGKSLAQSEREQKAGKPEQNRPKNDDKTVSCYKRDLETCRSIIAKEMTGTDVPSSPSSEFNFAVRMACLLKDTSGCKIKNILDKRMSVAARNEAHTNFLAEACRKGSVSFCPIAASRQKIKQDADSLNRVGCESDVAVSCYNLAESQSKVTYNRDVNLNVVELYEKACKLKYQKGCQQAKSAQSKVDEIDEDDQTQLDFPNLVQKCKEGNIVLCSKAISYLEKKNQKGSDYWELNKYACDSKSGESCFKIAEAVGSIRPGLFPEVLKDAFKNMNQQEHGLLREKALKSGRSLHAVPAIKLYEISCNLGFQGGCEQTKEIDQKFEAAQQNEEEERKKEQVQRELDAAAKAAEAKRLEAVRAHNEKVQAERNEAQRIEAERTRSEWIKQELNKANLAKNNGATHMFIRLKGCVKNVDESFQCEYAVFCEINEYINSFKRNRNPTNCVWRGDKAGLSFLFIAIGNKMPPYGEVSIGVQRLSNLSGKNLFGGTVQAAVWKEVYRGNGEN